MSVPADALTQSVAALVRAGVAGDLTEDAVRDEAAAFAAALCEATPQASREWAEALHLSEKALVDKAALGRPWRRQPTTLLSELVKDHNPAAAAYAKALAEIASAACSLGEATLRGAGVASVAAAVQLRTGAQAVAPVGYLSPAIAAAATPAELISRLGAVAAATAAATAAGAPSETTEPETTPEPVEDLASLNAELAGMIGLDNIKADVREQQRLLHNAQVRRAKGLKVPKVTRHLVFVGPPGVGKTVVARLISRIDRAMGIAAKGQLIETAADGLIAGYEGQTALKTAAKIQEALDGTLFIDEAYKLADSEFGTEAIAVLLKAMEDSRDRLRVIVAGYPDEMERFLDSNPGFAERFYKVMAFAPYTDHELVRIFELDCAYDDYTPTPECLDRLRAKLQATTRGRRFSNGRFVRNLFQATFTNQAARLEPMADPTVDELRTLTAADFSEDYGETNGEANGESGAEANGESDAAANGEGSGPTSARIGGSDLNGIGAGGKG